MNQPHKHAAVIKAWADGAQIETRDPATGNWRATHNNPPKWHLHREYRVKPKPHKWQKEMDAYAQGKTIQCRWNTGAWVDIVNGPLWRTDTDDVEYRVKPELVVRWLMVNEHGSLLQGAPDARSNTKLTFEDGKLIKAEVIS